MLITGESRARHDGGRRLRVRAAGPERRELTRQIVVSVRSKRAILCGWGFAYSTPPDRKGLTSIKRIRDQAIVCAAENVKAPP